MWLFGSVLFLVIGKSVTLDATFFNLTQTNCEPEKAMRPSMIFQYFKDQHRITLVDLSELRSDEQVANYFACTGGNTFKTIELYTNPEAVNLGPEILANSVTSLPNYHGWYLKGPENIIMNSLIPKLAAHNTRLKVLVFTVDSKNSLAAKEIVKIAYRKFKMLEVAVVVRPDQRIAGRPGSFCVFNPFKGNASVRAPDVDCVSFSAANLTEELKELDRVTAARISNLNQFPLNISVFTHFHYAKPIYDRNNRVVKYGYTDGAAADLITTKLNSKPVYFDQFDVAASGIFFQNGTLTTSLRAMEADESDYNVNNRLITSYPTKKALFMQANKMEKYVFVIKKRVQTRKLIMFPFEVFNRTTSFLSLAISMSLPLILAVVKALESKIRKFKAQSFTATCVQAVALQHNISVKQPLFASTRIVTLTIVLYALVTTALMQGTIVKILNIGEDSDAIDTIEKLLDNNFDFVVIRSLTDSLKKQSGSRLGEKLRKVAEKHFGVSMYDGLDMLLKNDKLAFLVTKTYCGGFLNKYYDNVTNENLYDVIPETAIEFFVAAIAPKASPFIDKINELTLMFIEYGLDIHHTRLAEFDNNAIWYYRLKNGLTPKPPTLSLKLKEMQRVFKFYAFAIFVSTLALVYEKLTEAKLARFWK